MNRIGRLEKMLDRISVIFAFLQQDGVTGCYQTCSGEEWQAGRGGGARGDCGGYWGDEVKGADIVRGGRARDYS